MTIFSTHLDCSQEFHLMTVGNDPECRVSNEDWQPVHHCERDVIQRAIVDKAISFHQVTCCDRGSVSGRQISTGQC